MQPCHIPGMDNPDDRKKALVREFCELDSQDLIEHNWSEFRKTGRVKDRVKPHLVKNGDKRST